MPAAADAVLRRQRVSTHQDRGEYDRLVTELIEENESGLNEHSQGGFGPPKTVIPAALYMSVN